MTLDTLTNTANSKLPAGLLEVEAPDYQLSRRFSRALDSSDGYRLSLRITVYVSLFLPSLQPVPDSFALDQPRIPHPVDARHLLPPFSLKTTRELLLQSCKLGREELSMEGRTEASRSPSACNKGVHSPH